MGLFFFVSLYLLMRFLKMFQDGAEAWCLGFQDVADPVVEEIVFFHDRVMFLLVIIVTVVLWLIGEAFKNKFYDRFLVDGTFLEII